MSDGEGKIIIGSGISWLLDTLQAKAEERLAYLKDGIAEGVPRDEYEQMVGRYKEAKRWKSFVIYETFAEFQQAEDSSLEEDGLQEMSDG